MQDARGNAAGYRDPRKFYGVGSCSHGRLEGDSNMVKTSGDDPIKAGNNMEMENLEDTLYTKWNKADNGKCTVDDCPCVYYGSCADCPAV